MYPLRASDKRNSISSRPFLPASGAAFGMCPLAAPGAGERTRAGVDPPGCPAGWRSPGGLSALADALVVAMGSWANPAPGLGWLCGVGKASRAATAVTSRC
jgi:hypothetical protein